MHSCREVNTYHITRRHIPENKICFGKCILYSAVLLNLTEVFPCFFLSCKANARVKLAKPGHGPHSTTLVVICVVLSLFALFYVLCVCKCVLPPGDNPTAGNKYINILQGNTHYRDRTTNVRSVYLTLNILALMNTSCWKRVETFVFYTSVAPRTWKLLTLR